MKLRAAFLAFALAAALSACTAVRVVTHSVNADPVSAPAGEYQFDAHHWNISFDVEHLKFIRFGMRFNQASAALDFVPNAPDKSHVKAVIKAASLDSNDKELDALVTGPDLFDATNYPDIVFESVSIVRTSAHQGAMTGNLTMHGQTHPVTLDVTFNGGAPNPLTRDHTLGFAATGAFDRSEWGLGKWYPAVGNEVRIRIEAEFVKTKG